MAATRRLYYDDSLLLAFRARVIAHGSLAGQPSVVLDQTGFYPESGGQMADRGALGGRPVRDVQVDDQGVVHHLVEGALPAVGGEVACEIERTRRRLHMALHTGQHMLSRALLDEAHAETVSSRLGETVCTIDLGRDPIDEREIARAESLASAVIDDDVPIRAFFPDPAQLAQLPLRREPKVAGEVRVVQIGDFDVSPCGGTHCERSAQVGLVKVTGVERYKGMTRISFQAGRRAREELGRHSELLRVLSRELTCGPEAVPQAIEKLRRELSGARESFGRVQGHLIEQAARELLADARSLGAPRVVAVFDQVDVGFLRALARRITAQPGMVALLAAQTSEGQHVVIARAQGSAVDCGALVKQLAAAHGGRGGGRPEIAEGRLPPGVDFAAAVEALGLSS
ncbi:MAG TPA: alanyl-tRNA editing protein [Polyangia bacterium]|nr:alanyl-tRNA editing protein [Polyangia bacterium]